MPKVLVISGMTCVHHIGAGPSIRYAQRDRNDGSMSMDSPLSLWHILRPRPGASRQSPTNLAVLAFATACGAASTARLGLLQHQVLRYQALVLGRFRGGSSESLPRLSA